MIRFTYRCPMRVEDMPAVAGGWQCTAGCGKVVVDLSALTEAQARQRVAEGEICGRLIFDQLGKPVFAAAAGAALTVGVARREVAVDLDPPLARAIAELVADPPTVAGEVVWEPPPPRPLIPEVPAGYTAAEWASLQTLGYLEEAPPPDPPRHTPPVGRLRLDR